MLPSRKAIIVTSVGFALSSTARTRADPPASQPANVQRPPLIGFKFHEPEISESVAMLEAGDTQGAIARLSRAERTALHGSPRRLNELRVASGMLLLRAGELGRARAKLSPLRTAKSGPELCRIARVLHGIAVR